MPRLGSAFATPGRSAFGNAGLVPAGDEYADCQMALGAQEERGFAWHVPHFGFVDSKLASADGKSVSTAFYATQIVHEVDEADASAVRGFYALDSDDVKKYHGLQFGKRLNDIKHLDTPGAIFLDVTWPDVKSCAAFDPMISVNRKPLREDVQETVPDARFLAGIIVARNWRLEVIDISLTPDYTLDDIHSFFGGKYPAPVMDPEPPTGLEPAVASFKNVKRDVFYLSQDRFPNVTSPVFHQG